MRNVTAAYLLRKCSDRIAALAEPVRPDAPFARAHLLHLLKRLMVERFFLRLASCERIERLAVELRHAARELRRVVLRLDAVRGQPVELREIGVEAEVLGEVEVIAAVLVDADRVLLASRVEQGIVAVEHLRIVELVEFRQAHRREVVVADHRLIRAVHDRLERQFRTLHDLAQLLERQLVRRRRHRKAVLLQELRRELIEEVKRYIRLHRQVRDSFCELQGAEVADHQAVRLDLAQCRKELLELPALAAHRRARRIDDDARLALRIGEDLRIVAELPRAQRAERLAADIDRVSTVVDCRLGRLDRIDAHTQMAVWRIRFLDIALLAQHLILEARFLDRMAEEARLALAREADVLLARLAERKRRREVARAVVVEILPAFFVRRIAVRVRDVGVDRLAVRRDDAADEARRAHAALNLEGEDARLDELRDGAVHAHILERELVGARPVLVEHFARLLVDELVSPAARLEAAAAVAALAKQHARVDALARLADAHVAVHEVLDLDARALAEEAELRQRHLAAHDNARDAVLLELLDGVLIVRVHHDRRVQRDCDAHLVHELEHRKILHEQRVRADFIEVGEVLAQRRDLLVADEVVERHIEAHPVRVRVVNGLLERGIVEVEPALMHAHVEVLAAEIDSIRTRLHARHQRIPSASRSQEFYRFAIE